MFQCRDVRDRGARQKKKTSNRTAQFDSKQKDSNESLRADGHLYQSNLGSEVDDLGAPSAEWLG